MLNAIIIDDEERARKTIAAIIDLHCPDIRIVTQAESVESGCKAIREFEPDIVFLDVKMHDGTGFDLLRKLQTVNFKVIFITAHEEFAAEAFRFSALDYILKPVDPKDLEEAVEKAEKYISLENIDIKLDTYFANIQSDSKENKKIVLRTVKEIFVVKVKDIIRCEADKNYTRLFFVNGKKLLVTKTLKEFEDMLSGYRFFRNHQSHMINMDFIDYYKKGDGGFIVMKDGATVPVSMRKKDSLLQILGSI
ncbi:MAG: LytTR family DNA-binding domain-containing protein [Bacteroidetes bacterium]|nr:LytTR family DNA-binding domain-containing protein [Bacteroidota bacterium]MBU1720510.1 LytTR family DNA-binding domain-containing protein [Bacteroidota bacterium]